MCGPLRDQEEMRGEAPRGVRLEHVVLENEVPRVGPIVRNLTRVVVTHHIALLNGALRARAAFGILFRAADVELGLGNETVHLPAVDVRYEVWVAVRASVICYGGIMEGLRAR